MTVKELIAELDRACKYTEGDAEDYKVYWHGKEFESVLNELVEEVVIDHDNKRILLS